MKKCPYCAEEIQDEDIKCKHCGERLDKSTTYSPIHNSQSGNNRGFDTGQKEHYGKIILNIIVVILGTILMLVLAWVWRVAWWLVEKRV